MPIYGPEPSKKDKADSNEGQHVDLPADSGGGHSSSGCSLPWRMAHLRGVLVSIWIVANAWLTPTPNDANFL